MTTLGRLIAIFIIYLVSFIAWQVLGGIVNNRTHTEAERLTAGVEELWGQPLTQQDPDVSFNWPVPKTIPAQAQSNGYVTPATTVTEWHATELIPEQSELSAGLMLDQRLKGLIWYSLYGVTFDGQWTYTSDAKERGELRVFIPLPDDHAMYDDFHFEIDGVEISHQLESNEHGRGKTIPVERGRTVRLHLHYKTRGMNQFSYVPNHANSLSRFHLRLATDFDAIDYPRGATSPTTKERTANGWNLDWSFAQVLSGKSMGLVTPTHIQPGQLAADLSYSAPVSLLFFFLILIALAAVRGLDIHPVNYLGIASAFFAFQLLFAYSVDHLPVAAAFAFSSAASIALVVSYLRLVVNARFALREAAAAQLVYQVGFALAHFWEGYTGLTLAVMATLTLFIIMQMTGRVRWTNLLAKSAAEVSQRTSVLAAQQAMTSRPAGP